VDGVAEVVTEIVAVAETDAEAFTEAVAVDKVEGD